MGSLYEGSDCFGSMSGASDFLELPHVPHTNVMVTPLGQLHGAIWKVKPDAGERREVRLF